MVWGHLCVLYKTSIINLNSGDFVKVVNAIFKTRMLSANNADMTAFLFMLSS